MLSLSSRQYTVAVLLASSVTGRPGLGKVWLLLAAISATLPVPLGERTRQTYPDRQAAGVV